MKLTNVLFINCCFTSQQVFEIDILSAYQFEAAFSCYYTTSMIDGDCAFMILLCDGYTACLNCVLVDVGIGSLHSIGTAIQ